VGIVAGPEAMLEVGINTQGLPVPSDIILR
jgi:hypothetical protein